LVNVIQTGKGYDGDDGTEKTKNAIGSIKKKITKHLQCDTTIKNIQGEFINAYCKFFGCSADWLLGYTDIQSANMEVRQICEKAGLSESAVNTIRRIIGPSRDCIEFGYQSEQFLKIINTLFSSEGFIELVRSISEFDERYTSYHSVWERLEEKLGEKLLDEAIDCYKGPIDYLNDPDAEKLSPELQETIPMVDAAIDKQHDLSYEMKVARYELRETFEALINEMYPKKDDNVRVKSRGHRKQKRPQA